MSRGIGGAARKVLEDEETVIYEYGVYNLNEQNYRNTDSICDGIITILKSALIEPEIHIKKKKTSSGRKKLITKRIKVDVSIEDLISQRLIVIENSSYCWKTVNGIDIMAIRLCIQLFEKYQIEGSLPDKVGYHV